MSAHILFSEFSPVNDGSQCVTDKWNEFIVACINRGLIGFVNRGHYRFDKMPNTISQCVRLEGLAQVSKGTTLYKNFAADSIDDALFCFNPGADGWSIAKMYIKNLSPNGSIVYARTDNTPDGSMTNFLMEDLNISLSDEIATMHNIYIDGSARNSGAVAKGARVSHMRNIIMFGSQGAGLVLKSVGGFSWYGGGMYPAGCSKNYSGSLLVNGTPEVNSSGIKINIQTCRHLILNRTINSRFDFNSIGERGGVSVEVMDGVIDVKVSGTRNGSINGTWSSSSWEQ